MAFHSHVGLLESVNLLGETAQLVLRTASQVVDEVQKERLWGGVLRSFYKHGVESSRLFKECRQFTASQNGNLKFL